MKKIRNGILAGLALALLLTAAAAAAKPKTEPAETEAVFVAETEAADEPANEPAAATEAAAAPETVQEAAAEAAPEMTEAAETVSEAMPEMTEAAETVSETVPEMTEAAAAEAVGEAAPEPAEALSAEEAEQEPAQAEPEAAPMPSPASTDEAAGEPAAETEEPEETAEQAQAETEVPEETTEPEEETETEEMTEPEEVRMLLTAAAPSELTDSYVRVTWTRVLGGDKISYTQGKEDDAIRAIDDGVWELYVQVYLEADGRDPLVDGTYTYEMVWPAPEGKKVTLAGDSTGGEIHFGDTSGTGSWKLGPSGELTLVFQDIGKLSAGAYGWISTFVTVSAEETGVPGDVPADAQIEKEGVYDAAAQRVFWKAAATVPAWDGGKPCSWCIEDTLKMVPSHFPESFQNDYTQMSVEYSVSGSDVWKTVPAAADAGGEDEVAWFCEQRGDGTAVIWFLNRCICAPGFCQSTDGVCENIKAADASGTSWCSCWHQIQNLDFALSYSGDTGELEQKIQDNGEKKIQLLNEADLLKNGMVEDDSEAMVTVHGAIEKLETAAPERDNSYSSTCMIRVNASFDDYSGADRIEVTDIMENLTYAEESMQITYQDADQSTGTLSEISKDQAETLAREGNENRYYSLACGEDGNLLITLWYPTQAAYEITYRAAVTDLVQGGITEYRNTAGLGKVSSTAEGRGFRVEDDWFAEEFEATIYKVDAAGSGEDPKMLPGAEFEVWQYAKDGEDLLVDTLTTGEDGTAVFRTRREDGVLIFRNTLYYLLESRAPEGYEKNEEKYYFYFSPDEDMVLPETIPALCGTDASLTLYVEDEPVASAQLPGAGGCGDAPLFALGLFLIFVLRRVPVLAESKH